MFSTPTHLSELRLPHATPLCLCALRERQHGLRTATKGHPSNSLTACSLGPAASALSNALS